MWRFIRTLLAFTLAFLLAMVIGGVLLVGAFTAAVGMLGSGKAEGRMDREGWLLISLAGELKEYEKEPMPFFSWQRLLWGAPEERPPTIEELRQALAYAQEEEKVKGIVLRMGDLSAQPAHAQQIGRWLLAFKQKTGKPVYAYGDYFSELTYYIASYADSIILYPGSGAMVEWNGLAAQGIFLRRFLEKWGVKPRLFRTGKYKSAAESFTEEKYSEDNRAQLTALLEDVWNSWIDTIAVRRQIPLDSLRAWPDRHVFFSAQQAFAYRLVDRLMPWQEWTRRFVPEGKEKPDFLSVQQLLRKPKKSDSQIAVLYAEGGIGPSEDITAEDLVPVIEKLAKEEKVKAVVLRVNSPGGAVLDSDKISRALRTLKAKKPLIVSMGGVAASGGYYISAFSDKIVAEPTTITGSIGVIGVLFDVRELLEKHVELRTDRVRVGGRYADFMSPYREASPEETQRMQAEIEGIYEEFLGIVREARRYPSRDAVHQIAQGRVWSGVDAREIGLVDTLGGLEAAIQIAAQKASLQEYVVVSFPEAKPFFQKWLKNMESVLYLFGLVQSRPILPEAFQARWPEEVKIY